MIRKIKSAGRPLGEGRWTATAFLRGQINADGGFRGRSQASDLYYSVFGYEALTALQGDMDYEAFAGYLAGFDDIIEQLDFNHVCALVRNRTNSGGVPDDVRQRLLRRLEAFRGGDGGFSPAVAKGTGTAYGAFLGLGAWQDLERELTDEDKAGLLKSLKGLVQDDGGYSNERGGQATTTTTAAALAVQYYLDEPTGENSREWLMKRLAASGGFTAGPETPMPDLLSTATAVHVLGLLGMDLSEIGPGCMDFLETLWSPLGGFRGQWLDETVDVEYTCYGLLTMGEVGNVGRET